MKQDNTETKMCECPEPDLEHGGCNACGLPVDPSPKKAEPPKPPRSTKVKADVNTIDLEGDHGNIVAGVCAECSRCGHETHSFGTSEASVRRCLVLLREECPKGERNFYEEE